jgi:hypothetical protein
LHGFQVECNHRVSRKQSSNTWPQTHKQTIEELAWT